MSWLGKRRMWQDGDSRWRVEQLMREYLDILEAKMLFLNEQSDKDKTEAQG